MLLWTGADRSSRENRPGQIYRGGAGAGGDGGDGEEGGRKGMYCMICQFPH